MKLRSLCLILLSFIALNSVRAQQLKPTFEQSKERIIKEDTERKQRVANFMAATGLQASYALSDGRVAYLVDVINNKPVYEAVDNIDAARNVGVSKLKNGGNLGLNLTGKDLRLLIWDDPQGARVTHREYGERITSGSDISGNSSDNHSSHVTGTVLAAGINPEAEGMASEATAVVYGFTNDVSEMTNELENNPESTILSNHSYGIVAGWTSSNGDWTWNGDEDISNTEDWKFGFYSSKARQFDDLAFESPYYTIVKSAGNHRSDVGDGGFPADGPYDIIAFEGVAKNIVTVAATQKLNDVYTGPGDVEISNFSSFGPADDGRIKPDIAAPGVAIRSVGAASDESYLTLQGTSMSTPVVMGGLALIQELHKNITGEFMTSAALKGLMIHTAHEAGDADGPDYQFGWGLFNADGMARMLLEQNGDNKQVLMADLADGETDTYDITPVQGSKVKVTIVWTDVPGTPVSSQLDPTDLMLVNDLDMRAAGETDTQMPWILNPEVPARDAEKGDNFRDNVEKIEFTAVDPTYTITINHKNSITEGPQDYALIIEYEKADASQTYYWVGNSGDWANAENWSLSSGGAAAGVVPTANDAVVFDDNSFKDLTDEETYAVGLSADAAVAQFRLFTQRQGTLDFGGNVLTVGGDLALLSDQVSVNNASWNMTGTRGNSAISLQVPTPGSDFVINGPDGSNFRFAGEVEANTIEVKGGDLRIVSSSIEVENFSMTGGSLTVEDSDLSLGASFLIESEGLDVTWSNSTLTVPMGESVNIDLMNTAFPADLVVAGEAQLTNVPQLNSITLTNTLTINSDPVVEDVALGAGSILTLGDGNSLTINGTFDPSGVEGDLISINSPGTATFALDGHRKICTDFFSISGVNYSGGSTLSIGLNSQLAGNEEGWIRQECDDVLFADFSFDYACVNSMVYFNDLSSGNVQGWDWAFHDGLTSTSQNVLRQYTTTGDFDVSLTVEDGSATNLYQTSINVIENDLDENTIRANGTTLISQRGATSHQWFRDDVLLPGENGQTLDTQGQQGTYFVLTFGENCNRISESFRFTVTSIEPDPEEQRQAEEAVNVFPNPTRDYIDVTVEGYTLRTLGMELVDQSGKVVTTSWHDNINSQSFSERLTVADKRQGFYILRFVVNENIIINRKVILTD